MRRQVLDVKGKGGDGARSEGQGVKGEEPQALVSSRLASEARGFSLLHLKCSSSNGFRQHNPLVTNNALSRVAGKNMLKHDLVGPQRAE